MRMILRAYRRVQKAKLMKEFLSVGINPLIDFNGSSFSYNSIIIGDNVSIGPNAWIFANIRIGNNVMFGPNMTIAGGDHLFGVIGKSVRFLKPEGTEKACDIIIEDEVWCGANVTILKGVSLGIGCVIGAGSVITKSIPPFCIAVGNPCKPIMKIFNNEQLEIHLTVLKYDNKFIKDVIFRRDSCYELEGLKFFKDRI